ncbi:MAG: GAF domain-containing protein, partial [Anaerolineae bacterium]|nr:GAF domain-containing protein [Anaerolineae bacterium]
VGIVLLLAPIYLLMRSGIDDLATRNAQSFVTQLGVKHATAVNNSITQARATLNNFTGDPDTVQVVTGYLLRSVRFTGGTYLPRVSEDQIASLIRANLLNPAASLFENVRLLDRSGQQIMMLTVNQSTFDIEDAAQSPAFRAIRSAQLQGDQAALAVTEEDGTPIVEVINTIPWRDGSPLGYVVVTLSNGRTFYNNIRVIDTSSDDYVATTFLTTAQGVLIAPTSQQRRVAAAAQSLGVTLALDGESGVTAYSGSDGVDYIGYYTPLGGTPFVLVTQTPTEQVNRSALGIFQARVFVVGAGVAALLVLLTLAFTQMTASPLEHLRRAMQALSDGNFNLPVPEARRGDEVGRLAASFVNTREQVRALVEDLESRVAARTRDISATRDISRFAATQRDLQMLMDRVVDLIVERFTNIYHAQIFLIDQDGRDAVLRASTGEVGRQLLGRGHRLGIGSLSVIGQVTQQGRLIVARDASVSQIHRRNEFLPETRAELAIPLRLGETILGALDVQSRIRDAFDEDQINVLQTMADQIAVAIQNAILYEESVRRFAEIEANNREATRRAWQEFSRDQRMDSIVKDVGFDTEIDLSDLRRAAIERGEPVVGEMTARRTVPLAVPVMLRGQVLGAVEWEIPAQILTEEKMELAKELANRLALSLDNARLFQESQRATERERLVNSIAAKLTAQTSINDILQTAVREVGQALRVPQVSIRLH